MRKQLEEDLIVALSPYITKAAISDVKLTITMILSKYDISKAETALIVYNGDLNEQIVKRFLAAKIAQGCSGRTIAYYKDTTSKILETIGKVYSDITADDIRAYIATRIYRDQVTKTTTNNERRVLSSFYGWLQKEEILLLNPMNKVENIKVTKAKKKAYSLIDLEKIRLGCRDNRERAMIEFLASTWCRASEMVEVKLSDLDAEKLIVHGKGDKYRTVYLNARAKLAIEIYIAERKDTSPMLFPGCKFQATSQAFHDLVKEHNVQKHEWYLIPELVSMEAVPDISIVENTIRAIGKRAGVKNVHPHRFRRTGATMALRQGMPLTTVSKLLGHESIETTQIYLDISDDELEASHRKYVV